MTYSHGDSRSNEIDEVAIYNVALSQADVQRLMLPAAVSAAGKLATTWAHIKN
jgi:hypothetical protein